MGEVAVISNALSPITKLESGRTVFAGYREVDVSFSTRTGRIVSVSEGNRPTECSVIDGKGFLLLPGFVNAHAHSSEHWMRGAIDMLPLELWLDPLVERGPLTVDHVRLAAQATAVEAVLSGCTSVLDHIFVPPGRMDLLGASVEGFSSVGVRLFTAPMVGDSPAVHPKNFPCFGSGSAQCCSQEGLEPWAKETDETIKFLERVISKFQRPENGVSVVVAPSGVQWCSTSFLEACIGLARKHNLPFHTHLAETAFQKQLASERPDAIPDDTAAAFLARRFGGRGLDRKTSFAHAIHVTDGDIELLARSGATVVHNPLSNLRLGSGIAPVLRMRDAGVNVALGCDGAASNDSQSMLEVIKQAAILHNHTEGDHSKWLRPAEVLQMATENGARALGVEGELGRIAPGMRADFTLFDLHALSMLPRADPLGLLVLGRPDREAIQGVWISGKQIVDRGKVLTIDEAALRRSLFDLGVDLAGKGLLHPNPEYESGYINALQRKQRQEHHK